MSVLTPESSPGSPAGPSSVPSPRPPTLWERVGDAVGEHRSKALLGLGSLTVLALLSYAAFGVLEGGGEPESLATGAAPDALADVGAGATDADGDESGDPTPAALAGASPGEEADTATSASTTSEPASQPEESAVAPGPPTTAAGGEGAQAAGEVPASTATTTDPDATTSTTEPPTTAPPATEATTSTTAAPTTAPPTTAPPTTAPATTQATGGGGVEQQVLDLVNAERALASCGALTLHPQLTAAADAHSEDMAANNYFDHTGLDGSKPWDRARAAGYGSSFIGENIAQGYGSAESVMNGWMNSSGHRANILNCGYQHLGVGLSSQGNYWTQLFGGG